MTKFCRFIIISVWSTSTSGKPQSGRRRLRRSTSDVDHRRPFLLMFSSSSSYLLRKYSFWGTESFPVISVLKSCFRSPTAEHQKLFVNQPLKAFVVPTLRNYYVVRRVKELIGTLKSCLSKVVFCSISL